MTIRFDPWTGSYRYETPTIETRADAIRHEVFHVRLDVRLVEATEQAVKQASASLGLSPVPRVRWLSPEVRALRGVVFPDALGEIWVRAQDAAASRETALHELKHIHQLRDHTYVGLGLDSYEQRQADAQHFAESWTPAAQPSPSPSRHPAPAPVTRSYHAPSASEAARAARVASFFEHKGRRCWRCEHCAAITPLNSIHRCPMARTWRP